MLLNKCNKLLLLSCKKSFVTTSLIIYLLITFNFIFELSFDHSHLHQNWRFVSDTCFTLPHCAEYLNITFISFYHQLLSAIIWYIFTFICVWRVSTNYIFKISEAGYQFLSSKEAEDISWYCKSCKQPAMMAVLENKSIEDKVKEYTEKINQKIKAIESNA